MGLFDWFKQKDEKYSFSLEGTETVTCDEIDKVMNCLEFIGSAASLYPIKPTAEIDSDLTRRLLAYTDAMTEKQVEDMHEGVVELMNWLTKGGSSPLKIKGTMQIVHGLIGGVLLTMNDEGQTINFPYGGIKANHGSQTHTRIAEKADDKLRLRWVVDGAPDVASVSSWVINLSSGRMSFTCKESRYQQIKDYGRVLLNQDMKAAGQLTAK